MLNNNKTQEGYINFKEMSVTDNYIKYIYNLIYIL